VTLALVIVSYAAVLLLVRCTARAAWGRPQKTIPDVKQGDGTYNYLPSHTLAIFVLTAIWLTWCWSYDPGPNWIELAGIAMASTGWLMLGLRLLLWGRDFRIIGFEGRKPIIFAALGFLLVGTVLVNLP
jgi:hypothetical protein